MIGGPMYYLKYGAHSPIGAALYALSAVFASFGIGNICQSNSASTVLAYEFGVPQWLTGSLLTLFCGMIILRGVKGIAKFTSIAIPIIDLLFLLCGLFAILANLDRLPQVCTVIWQDAFRPAAAGGGLFGALISQPMRYGISRGIFSSEAGLGSAPIAAAAAQTKTSVRQGLISMTGTFIDTIVICSCSAMIMLLVPSDLIDGLSGMELLQAAMHYHMGDFGVVFIAAIMWLFSFSTFIGILFYARSNVAYLFGDNWLSQTLYKVLALVMLFVGGMAAYTFVWDLGDLGIGLMTVFNMMALIPLASQAVDSLRDYEKKMKGR